MGHGVSWILCKNSEANKEILSQLSTTASLKEFEATGRNFECKVLTVHDRAGGRKIPTLTSGWVLCLQEIDLRFHFY